MVASSACAALAALSLASGARVRLQKKARKPYSTCGQKGESAPSTSIVNGQPATECEWRWQAMLMRNGWDFCGGTLISPEWVLSAAHCVSSAKNLDVRFGDHNYSRTSGNEQNRRAVEVYRHPQYTEDPPRNDYVMIKLDRPVEFNGCVGTACLPTGDVAPGTKCWITGWGALMAGGAGPQVLQETSVDIISNEECTTKYSYKESEIDETMICAQGQRGDGKTTDACQGDSGGPLVCDTPAGWTLYGATSWGKGCAAPRYPGVWARVNHVMDWVEDILAGNIPTPAPTPAPSCPGYCFVCLLPVCKDLCDFCKNI